MQELVSFTPGVELDESAPLSASDLHTLLDRIESRSEEIKDRVHKTVTKNYPQFLSIISGANGTVADVEAVARDLKSILDALGERREEGGGGQRQDGGETEARLSFDLEICQLAADAEQLRRDGEEREQAIAVVQAIAELHETLQSTEREFLDGRLIEASGALCELRESLGLPADWTGDRDDQKARENQEKINPYTFLQDAWVICYSKLISFLEDLFLQSVVLDESTCELCVTPCLPCGDSDSGVDIVEVELWTILAAMDNVGVLNMRLAKLGDILFKGVLEPILHDMQIEVVIGELVTSMSQQRKAVLSWKSCEYQSDIAGQKDVYSKLLKVFSFLRTNLLVENDQWVQCLGRIIWPRLAEAIITKQLRKSVPNDIAELAEFQKSANVTAEFEACLGSAGLIPDWDETKGDRLSKFSSDVEVHFALKKKKHVLAKARYLLVQNDYTKFENNNEEIGTKDSDENGDMSLLWAEKCAITYPAKQLLELMHKTLQDACMSTPQIAMELYHAARDAILLYRSIVPVMVGYISEGHLHVAGQLDSVHQVTALCHNDCFHIAHQLLLLKFQYSGALPSNVQEVFTFVDLVPLFRRLGCDILEGHLHLIKLNLMEALNHANGFQFTDQKKHFDTANDALHQMMIVLTAVLKIWQPLLAASVCELAMGKLLEAVVGRLVNEVLAFEDISVEECGKLRKLMMLALESLSPLLGSASGDGDGADVTQSRDAAEKLVPSWRKLARLTDLLDMSLRPITQSWESGDLTSCGFSSEEVQKLIKAIFSETPLRTECLAQISSH